MKEFKSKTRTCIICGSEFLIDKWFKSLNKTCCYDCKHENQLRISREQAIRKKAQIINKICRYCGKEVVSTAWCPRNFCGGKAGECYKKFLSESRKGKKNPAYRNGFAISGSRKYTGIHLRACSKYRKAFLEKHGYLFCESCNINSNGTPKFEVHHIYYASLYPKHKELHNTKNLILLCLQCHNDFHSSKRKEEFLQIEEARGLKELFTKNGNN